MGNNAEYLDLPVELTGSALYIHANCRRLEGWSRGRGGRGVRRQKWEAEGTRRGRSTW